MEIGNQYIYGGQQQFADTIINGSKTLSTEDAGLVKFIYENAQSETQKTELVQALEVIKDVNKPTEEKSKAKELWKKFYESGITELAKEAAKGLASPTFWAFILS